VMSFSCVDLFLALGKKFSLIRFRWHQMLLVGAKQSATDLWRLQCCRP
jgi:hypothetical protein